jgi:hypothetical protein
MSRRHEANGYRTELTPGNLLKFLAKGQQSTDLNIPEKRGLSAFGCSSPDSHHHEMFMVASFG